MGILQFWLLHTIWTHSKTPLNNNSYFYGCSDLDQSAVSIIIAFTSNCALAMQVVQHLNVYINNQLNIWQHLCKNEHLIYIHKL